MATNFHGFTDSKVVAKAAFLFVLHCHYRFKVVFGEIVRAVLVVLGDSRVIPFLFLNSPFVFVPARVEGSSCLANVN